ncbi:MAG: hypothetical protein ACE5Q6_08555 [Dehalococcoidia bacterium]
MEPTRPYKTVSASTWRQMLRIAHILDVGRGGLYDARSGCINLWVSPDDHPPCWDGVDMTAGVFREPREYLGGIMAKLTEDLREAVLTLEVTPYERMPKRQPGRFPEPLEDEWEWVTRKANDLLELAERTIEPPGADFSTFCRFCEAPVKASLLNDFLEHLQGEHNLNIIAVGLGNPAIVMTNIGPLEV